MIFKLFIFLYLFVFLLGTIFTTLLSIIVLKNKSAFLKELRNFSAAFLLYGVFEFILYYFVQVSAENWLLIIAMVCSDTCYYLFILCWLFSMASAYKEIKMVPRKYLILPTIFCATIAELVAISNISPGDDAVLFLFQNHVEQHLVLVLDLGYSACLLLIALRYVFAGVKQWREKNQRIFLLLPVGLSAYLLWIMKWDYLLVTKQVVRGDDLTLADPIVSIYIFVCVYAIYYVYKHNFMVLPAAPTAKEEELAAEEKPEELSVAEKYGLTKREKEVLELVYEGLNSGAIAERLFISEYTVKRHLNNIFKKTGCKSRFELLAKKNNGL